MTQIILRNRMRRIVAICLLLTIMTGDINAYRHHQCKSKLMCSGTHLMMRKSITALYSAALSNEEKVKKREMDSTKELPPNPILEEVKSNTVLYSAVLSNDVRVKNIAIDSIRDLPPNAILERVQRGLARLTENIPRPILITVVAVASGLLFFELSKALLLLALPVIAVLGGMQSLSEGVEGAAKGNRIYDTDVIDFSTSSTAFPEYHTQKGGAEWGSTSSASPTSSTLEELERQSKERSGRLAAIQRRISETSGDLRTAISSASTLRDKLTSYVDKIDKVGVKGEVAK